VSRGSIRIEFDVLRFAKPDEIAAPGDGLKARARGSYLFRIFFFRKKSEEATHLRVSRGSIRIEFDVLRFAKPDEIAARFFTHERYITARGIRIELLPRIRPLISKEF
jgi:hypothetical protein